MYVFSLGSSTYTAHTDRVWRYPFPSFVRSMPSKPCPTLNCRAWTANVGRQWYPLQPGHDFSLQLDDSKLAVHQRVCESCWNLHRYPHRPLNGRIRKPNRFEQLLSAAEVPMPLMSSVKQFVPRRTYTLKEKESICREWSESSTTVEKQAVHCIAHLHLSSEEKKEGSSCRCRAAHRHDIDPDQAPQGQSSDCRRRPR